MISEYLNYLKDNPKGYWFKRKLYGWGWTPAKWQGWLVTLLFILYIVIAATVFVPKDTPLAFVLSFLIGLIVFLYIAYKTGESPKWMWGIEK